MKEKIRNFLDQLANHNMPSLPDDIKDQIAQDITDWANSGATNPYNKAQNSVTVYATLNDKGNIAIYAQEVSAKLTEQDYIIQPNTPCLTVEISK